MMVSYMTIRTYTTMKNVKDAAFILEDNDLRTLEALFWVHSKGGWLSHYDLSVR